MSRVELLKIVPFGAKVLQIFAGFVELEDVQVRIFDRFLAYSEMAESNGIVLGTHSVRLSQRLEAPVRVGTVIHGDRLPL